MKAHNRFARLVPGTRVLRDGRAYVLGRATGNATHLAKDEQTGETVILRADEMEIPRDEEAPPPPDTVKSGPEYERAQRILDAMKPLLENPLRTEANVIEAAKMVGMGKSRFYWLMRAYQDAPDLSTLIPDRPGPEKGGRKLSAELEAIVAAALLKTHRTKQRQRVSETIKEVGRGCKAAGLEPPHDNTIRARVAALPRARTLRERGYDDEAKALRPLRGNYEARRPLEIVQMDHHEADVELVDDLMRLPIGRPWITVLIDVCTRMVVGLSVSMQRPSAFMAGTCVASALMPKAGYLKRIGVEGVWDAWGQITNLHMDNAKEFRGNLIKTSCEAYGINPIYRPVRTPHYGGHIERLMGTIAGEIRNLPGATYSNPKERKGTDPEKTAALTVSEFERHLVDWIVNVYHKRGHAGLDGIPPATFWEFKTTPEDGKPSGLVQSLPRDPERLRIDFLPFKTPTVSRNGLRVELIDYQDDYFAARVAEPDPKNRKAKRKYLVRYDPRNLSYVWALVDETGLYRRVPMWRKGRPAVSLWEWRAVKMHFKALGKKAVDDDAMFRKLAELRDKAAAALARTKTARKQHQLAAAAAKHAAADPAPERPPAAPAAAVERPSRPLKPKFTVDI
jgi:putative transposase